jgi:hypothetical protein
MIVRGAKNKKISFDGYDIPSTAKLWLQTVSLSEA